MFTPFKKSSLFVGMAHFFERQLQVINAHNGQVTVFNGNGHGANPIQEPIILVHGDNQYQV